MFIILYSPNPIRMLVFSKRRKVLKCLGFWYVVNKRLSLTTGACNYYK